MLPIKVSQPSSVLTFVLLLLFSYFFSNTPVKSDLQAPPSPTISNPTSAVKGAQISPSQQPVIFSETVKVTRIVDGDTIVIEGNRKLRYIGIDTPESVDPRQSLQCYGNEASQRNKKLVEGQLVTLEKDVSETDRYGRLLRYVYLNGVMINKQLVEEGFAQAASYPPDIKHQKELNQAQQTAQHNNVGLWSACNNKIN